MRSFEEIQQEWLGNLLTKDENYRKLSNGTSKNTMTRVDPGLLPILQKYNDFMRLKGVKTGSRITSITVIRDMSNKLGKVIDKSITKDEIEKYLLLICNQKWATQQRKRATIKVFFKWLYGIRKKDKYPSIVDWIERPIKNGEKELLPEDLLTYEEILKMASSTDSPRDKALVMLLFDSGARVSEIINTNVSDLKFEIDGTAILTVDGKTGRRQIPLSYSVPALREWLNNHPFKNDSKAPLFISIRTYFGNRMRKQHILRLVKQISKRAGIDKRVFCHLFRHVRASDLTKKGISGLAMKSFFGWNKYSQMPDRYSHLVAKDVTEAVQRADGIQKIKLEDNQTLQPVVCKKCGTPNIKSNMLCFNCTAPLSEDAQEEIEAKREFMQLIFQDDVWKFLQSKMKK